MIRFLPPAKKGIFTEGNCKHRKESKGIEHRTGAAAAAASCKSKGIQHCTGAGMGDLQEAEGNLEAAELQERPCNAISSLCKKMLSSTDAAATQKLRCSESVNDSVLLHRRASLPGTILNSFA